MAAVLAIGLLAGCTGVVPVYRPQGPGSLASFACSVPLSTLVVPLATDVDLLVGAGPGEVHPVEGEQILLDVALLIGSGHEVRFSFPSLVLTSPSWPAPRAVDIIAIENWSAVPKQSFAPDAVVPGSDATRRPPGFGLSFAGTGPRAQTGLPVVDRFDVEFPAVEVDGAAMAPIVVVFELDRAAHARSCD